MQPHNLIQALLTGYQGPQATGTVIISAIALVSLVPCSFFSITSLKWEYKGKKDKFNSVFLVVGIWCQMMFAEMPVVSSLLATDILFRSYIFYIASDLKEGLAEDIPDDKPVPYLSTFDGLFGLLADFSLSVVLLRILLALFHQPGLPSPSLQIAKVLGTSVAFVINVLDLAQFAIMAHGQVLSRLNEDAALQGASDDTQYMILESISKNTVLKDQMSAACAWVSLMYTLTILLGGVFAAFRVRRRDQVRCLSFWERFESKPTDMSRIAGYSSFHQRLFERERQISNDVCKTF